MANPKLLLSDSEKQSLKEKNLKIRDMSRLTPKFISESMGISIQRAKELKALVEFQSIPSIGYKFATKLIFLEYYSLDELKEKDPVTLINDLEQQLGVWMDPCVEDQFRLVVYYSNHRDSKKQWWDFTDERKKYRAKYGYPNNRPTKAWHESS